MKLNKKLIIPAFTLLVGSALAGSVSGTVAWYQYSTKSNVAYIGTSIGTARNLKVRIKKADQAADADWGSEVTYSDVQTYLQGKKLTPITSGAMGKDAALPAKFYSNPICGNGPLSLWEEAPVAAYVQIPLQFKFIERDGSLDASSKEVESFVAKDLYLSDLLIQNDYSNAAVAKRDLSSAVRVHFDAYLDDAQEAGHVRHLASKDGADTLTVGALDLDGDGKNDKSYAANEKEAMYGFGTSADSKGTVIQYGTKEGENPDYNQKSYSATGILDSKLGTTSAVAGKYLNVMVTIWLEGWQKLPIASDSDQNVSSMWDLVKTVDSKFDIGMQFEAKDAA